MLVGADLVQPSPWASDTGHWVQTDASVAIRPQASIASLTYLRQATTAASFAKGTSRQNNLQLTGILRKEKAMRLLRRPFCHMQPIKDHSAIGFTYAGEGATHGGAFLIWKHLYQ
jgi:hypothetical protein